MCQQTVEKALKAVIAKKGVFPPKSHDLARLAELACIQTELDDERNALLDELYPLSIESRYPSNYEALAKTLNDEKCAAYISRTEAFLQWIKKML